MTSSTHIQGGAHRLLRDLADWDRYVHGMYRNANGATCAVGHLIFNHVPAAEALFRTPTTSIPVGESIPAAIATHYDLSLDEVGDLLYVSDLAGDCETARYEIASYFGLGE